MEGEAPAADYTDMVEEVLEQDREAHGHHSLHSRPMGQSRPQSHPREIRWQTDVGLRSTAPRVLQVEGGGSDVGGGSDGGIRPCCARSTSIRLQLLGGIVGVSWEGQCCDTRRPGWALAICVVCIFNDGHASIPAQVALRPNSRADGHSLILMLLLVAKRVPQPDSSYLARCRLRQ